MFVRDLPLAVDLAKAEGLAKPEVDFFTFGGRRHHPVQTVAESDVVARCDIEVAIFVVDRALGKRKTIPARLFLSNG